MTFTEDWYSDEQLEHLTDLLRQTLDNGVKGMVVEIGCWEGRSTVALAKTAQPYEVTLHAVDWWLGNLDEGVNHASVVGARERDVYRAFLENIEPYPNVNVYIQDGEDYLADLIGKRIAFIHLDAGHTFKATNKLIRLAEPLLSPGAIICGDDYLNAHAGRHDLGGGVERAVRENFGTQFQTFGNLWYYEKVT